jgi:tetratricopeptide (TPR) repeat protein
MDLDESIQIMREAINATPENHPNLICRLNNLGTRLCNKFSATSELKFIEEAIELGQKALRATPESHIFRAQLLYNLGARFEVLFSQTRNLDDINESARLMRESLHSQYGVPLTRIIAGVSAALKLVRFSRWSESVSILQYVFDLLPKIALRTSSRDDLQHTIENIAGASTLAASVFLKAGLSPLHALQVLEQGRGIISGLVIDARSDVSLLREHHRDLYYKYDQARKAVAMPPSSTWLFGEAELPHSSNNRYALESLQRHEAARKLDEVLQEIRKQPDFERFQLAPTEKEILDFTGLGPLVSFNVSNVSAEAFIVTRSAIKVLPLPNIKKSELLQNVKILANQGNQSRRDANLISGEDEQSAPQESAGSGHHLSEIASRMSSLWVNAVKPVLDELGLITARKLLL